MTTIQPFDDATLKALIDAAMAKASAPLNSLTMQKKTDDVKISLYGNISNFISGFQKALTAVGTAFDTIAFQSTTSNAAVASIDVVNNSIAAGNHTINVTQLAQGQTSTSGTFTASTIDSGATPETLSFNGNGGVNFSVAIAAGESLQTIANSINTNNSNFGITASVITSYAVDNVTPQYTLAISSNTIGANSAFSISGDTGSLFNFSQTTLAQNSLFSFDSYNETSSSNTTSDVIDGLNINLLSLGTTNISITVNKTNQISAVNTAINNMVSDYNQLISFMDGAQSDTGTYDKKTNRLIDPGTSDALIPYVKSLMQTFVNQTYTGAGSITSLFNLGIDLAPSQTATNPNTGKIYNIIGLLQVDPTVFQNGDNTFTNNLNNNFNAVQQFFTDPTNGLITVMSNSINNNITESDNTGAIWRANNAVTQMEYNLENEIQTEKARLANVEDGLKDKYASMNAMISKFSLISQALTSSLGVISRDK